MSTESSVASPNKRARHGPSPSHHASPKASTSTARVPQHTVRTSARRKKPRANSPSAQSVTSTLSNRTDIEMRDGTTELEDMTAAAALTSLLHNNNNSSGSGASGPHSPTLSHASYESESLSRAPVSSSRESQGSGALSPAHIGGRKMTPKPAVDADAAELMLFLATSPSPARANIRRSDRTTSGRNAGRVLFPTSSTGSGSSADDSEPGGSFDLSHEARPSRHLRVDGMNHSKLGGSVPEIIVPGELLPSPPSPSLTATAYSQSDPSSQDTAVGLDDEATSLEQAFVPSKTVRSSNSLLPSPLNTPFRGKESFSGITTPSSSNPSLYASQGGRRQPTFSITEYLNVSPSSPARMTTIPVNTSPYSHAAMPNDNVGNISRRLFEDDVSPSRLSAGGSRQISSGRNSVPEGAGDLVGASA